MGDRIEGRTLSDEHDNDPNPPTEYGRPDPRTVIEMVGLIAWAWHTENSESYIDYRGELVDVKQ